MAKKRANGEGSIRKRSDGRWEGRYTAGYDQDGKRIIKNVLGRTQAEVKAKLSVAITESQQLDVSRSGEYTVTEWLPLWFELYAKPNIRPSTAGYYRRAMEEYTIPRIGSVKLNKLTSREIQKLYKDLLEKWEASEKAEEKEAGSQRLHRAGRPHHAPQCPGPCGKGTTADPQSRRQLRGAKSPAPRDENAATGESESLSRCSGTAECLGYVLSGVGQRHPQRRAGGLAVGGPGRGAADHLRQQTGHEGRR